MKMRLERLENGNVRVGIPVPFPMKYVYCYLMKNDSGYTMVDTGFHYSKATQAWEEIFNKLRLAPGDIHTIVLTHFHPDHSGLAGWMQAKTGANVWMSEVDLKMMQLAFGEGEDQKRQVEKLLTDHGVPSRLREEIHINLQKVKRHVQPLHKVKDPNQDNIILDNRTWEVIETPGHSEGHLCFYEKKEKILLAGDMILDKITPNISLWPGGSKYPLYDYLNSLKKLEQLPIKEAWPGHGEIIYHVPQRLATLIHHHKDRLEKISLLATNKSGFEITSELFKDRELNPHQWRFAISETLAHLEYLVEKQIVKNVDSGPVLYTTRTHFISNWMGYKS